MRRESGILLHPTSLPGRWGMGTLGDEAVDFMDWASDAGFTWWQVLPLGPTGYGNSPYMPLSSFAGNPLLLSPGLLRRDGLLTDSEAASAVRPEDGGVDWGDLLSERPPLLRKAAGRALRLNPPGYADFREDQKEWLDPWASYAALKQAHGGGPWREWSLRSVDEDAAEEHRMLQFLFQSQWDGLLRHCQRRGMRILGDLPIYTAHDSADVWSRKDLFRLDRLGDPLGVAGVPPDYFSATGQLWGNPLYRWPAHAREGYRWWALRLKQALRRCHRVRIDHFRGFCGYWEVPADADTAERGRWRKGPGGALFRAVAGHLGGMPHLVAEDLGLITPDVHRLRDRLGFPGMVVLQFALDDPEFHPSRVHPNTVLYTGTHDNDTTRGWLEARGTDLSLRDVVGIALGSPAWLAVLPVQDILGLGSEARMNTPGRTRGNWSFRLRQGSLDAAAAREWRSRISGSGRA